MFHPSTAAAEQALFLDQECEREALLYVMRQWLLGCTRPNKQCRLPPLALVRTLDELLAEWLLHSVYLHRDRVKRNAKMLDPKALSNVYFRLISYTMGHVCFDLVKLKMISLEMPHLCR
jgi:hypothetical protein